MLGAQSSAPSMPNSEHAATQRSRLRDVKTVYVGSFGSADGAEMIRAKVLASILRSGKLDLVEVEGDADAVLTGVASTTATTAQAALRLVARSDKRILWADDAPDRGCPEFCVSVLRVTIGESYEEAGTGKAVQ